MNESDYKPVETVPEAKPPEKTVAESVSDNSTLSKLSEQGKQTETNASEKAGDNSAEDKGLLSKLGDIAQIALVSFQLSQPALPQETGIKETVVQNQSTESTNNRGAVVEKTLGAFEAIAHARSDAQKAGEQMRAEVDKAKASSDAYDNATANAHKRDA